MDAVRHQVGITTTDRDIFLAESGCASQRGIGKFGVHLLQLIALLPCLLFGHCGRRRGDATGHFFKNHFLERYIHMKIYDSETRNKPSGLQLDEGSCDSCMKTGPKNQFMRCGGCKQVSYCSKACQTRDWKINDHKEFCKSQFPQFKKYESGFLRFLAQEDGWAYFRNGCELRSRLFSKRRPEELWFVIDYTKVPNRVDVRLISDSDPTNKAQFVMLLRNSKLRGPGHQHYAILSVTIVEGVS